MLAWLDGNCAVKFIIISYFIAVSRISISSQRYQWADATRDAKSLLHLDAVELVVEIIDWKL